MPRILLLLLSLLPLRALSAETAPVRYHDREADSLKVETILAQARQAVNSANPQDYTTAVAKRLLGTPYVAHTLESDDATEWMTVNLGQLDCTTFVETVCALARVAAHGGGWPEYIDQLRQVRYRSGVIDGYPSRLHYVAQWVTDNSAMGLIEDVTPSMPVTDDVVKTINFMSTHRASYPALAHDAVFEEIKRGESSLVDCAYEIVTKESLLSDDDAISALREGDIVALATDLPGLDVTHMGLITIVDGQPHLLHASSKAMRVIIDPLPIGRYLARSPHATGLRVLRLK